MTRRELTGPLLIVLAAAVAYGPTIDDYFLQDDFGVVWLMSQRSVADVPRWFVSSWMENIWGFNPDEIRPFPALSFQPAALFGAGSPIPHHVTTLAFHIATGVLVYATARTAVGLGPAAATFAGVLFVLLPNQTETAAWITGRVDSIPAFFYLASFLAYARWRINGRNRAYVWSLVWCFVALFSKQTAITLAPALVLYDFVVARRRPQPSWSWLRAYVPFILLTGGYLLLRYIVFADVVREGLLTTDRVRSFPVDAAHHLARVAFGHDTLGNDESRTVMVASLLVGLAWLFAWRTGGSKTARLMAYVGIVWTLIGIAPTLVAGYSSPRHVYQASIGWALALAITLDGLWHGEPRRVRRAFAGTMAVVLLGGYAVQLRNLIVDWGVRAAVSRKAVMDLEREAQNAPDGALLLVGLTPRSWNYAIPFVRRPPFTREDRTGRVPVISHSSLYCCPDFQWEKDTRRALRDWATRLDRPPVVAMRWNARTGELRRLSDREDPYLRGLVMLLLESGDRATLDSNINRMLEEFVAFHQAAS